MSLEMMKTSEMLQQNADRSLKRDCRDLSSSVKLKQTFHKSLTLEQTIEGLNLCPG